MPGATFGAALDYLQRSGLSEARLLGGEPTAHPDFVGLLGRAAARFERVTVFTGGVMDDACLAALAALPERRCSVVLNVNEADERTLAGEWERQREVVAALGSRVTPGFTIHRLPVSWDDLLGLYAPADSRRRPGSTLRIGLAQPGLRGARTTLTPQRYPEVGRQLVLLGQRAAALGLRPELDCGFVRCMLSAEELDTLLASGSRPTFRCSPVVDIWPDGQARPCFALARHWSLGSVLSQTDEPGPTHAEHLRVWRRKARLYKGVGILVACASCPHLRSAGCAGGCLARVRARSRPVAPVGEAAP